jgi:MFS family permease
MLDDDQAQSIMDNESTKLLRHDSKNAPDGVDSNALSSLVGDLAGKAEISVFRLFFLNMFAFNYGLFYASVGVLLLPEEALRMFAEDHAVFLAVMLALAGISQLISPLAGYCSDRDTHRMGRRLPYILGGNAVLLCMIGCLYLARTFMYGWAYLALLLVAIVALNVAYTGFTGLISDVIPSSQMGFASGVMGGLTAAGAVLGLVTIGRSHEWPTPAFIFIMIVVVTIVVVSMFISCSSLLVGPVDRTANHFHVSGVCVHDYDYHRHRRRLS